MLQNCTGRALWLPSAPTLSRSSGPVSPLSRESQGAPPPNPCALLTQLISSGAQLSHSVIDYSRLQHLKSDFYKTDS